jgi:glycosyltransferase involved in cell wall biosynthesis
MQKLKIGFDAKRLFYNKSGLGNYSRTLVANLKKFFPEHEYHLFVSKLPKDNSHVKEFLEGDFIIHTNQTLAPNMWWRSIGCSAIINKLNLDVFHGLSHEIPFGIGPQTKKIVSFHDLIFAKMPHLFSRIDSLLYNLKYSSAIKRSDGVVAISESTARDINEFYGYASKIKVIYQACDSFFCNNPIEDTIRDYYLYVGTINARKNLDAILKAYLLLPSEYQLPFHIIGEGGSYKDSILQQLAKTNVENKFLFHGHVDNPSLLKFYKGAIALVYPSLYEGFGIPVIEALFNGCPVITSETSSMPEAVGPGGKCINPLDIFALKDAMIEFNNANIARDYAKAGLEYANNTFNAKELSRQLMNYYYSEK